MTLYTGTPPTFAAGDNATVVANLNLFRDALKAVSEAWTSYTPTWTATTTNPTIGNGSFSGSAYLRVNKLIIGRAVITMGSTTTYGSGTYSIGLPVGALSANSARMLKSGNARDASATSDYPIFGILTGAVSEVSMRALPTTAGNALTAMTPTFPFTLANTDSLVLEFVYEAA